MGLITNVSSELLNEENYDADNGFIQRSFRETMKALRAKGCSFLGLARAPWVHSGRWQAIVYEDDATFSLHWCHVGEFLAALWEDEERESL